MKLENNSLRYGVNSANNANSAFNNAYNQEMANQRDMQGQISQRQKTLLEGMVAENNYKQAERNMYYGFDSKTGKGHIMGADPSYDKGINDILETNTAPLRKFDRLVKETVPYTYGLNEDGSIAKPMMSAIPFSNVSTGVVYHPDNVAKAQAEGITPEERYRRFFPNIVQQKGI